MSERVFLIHGWSVAETSTYQALHLKLAEHGFNLQHIFLGRYVSLDDHVEIKDLAAALHNALMPHLGKPPWSEKFNIITHSTGALIAKEWILKHYNKQYSKNKALQNVVFLAGPHFGSRLAHHGRSMVAHIKFLGDTGHKILTALELGSQFSWENNEAWLKQDDWKEKGIRPYCLIGDKTSGSFFAKKLFPAGFEKGSDMVVRVPAGNLNFKRYRLDAQSGKLIFEGGISGIPFVPLYQYTHSGKKYGIMNSITQRANPESFKYQNLRLILDCLGVQNNNQYKEIFSKFKKITQETRSKKNGNKYVSRPFAQLDLQFFDNTGSPIEDYSFTLGAIVNGKSRPSKTIVHIHKNKKHPNHLTAFLDMKEFEPQLTYFMKFDSDSGTDHFKYFPAPYEQEIKGKILKDLLTPDQTTQIKVVLGRESGSKLFVFHRGDDIRLHLKWNRDGDITKKYIKPE